MGRIKVACIPLHYIYRGRTKIAETHNYIIKNLINASRTALILLGMFLFRCGMKKMVYWIHSLCSRTSLERSVRFKFGDWGGDGRISSWCSPNHPWNIFAVHIGTHPSWNIGRSSVLDMVLCDHAKQKSLDLMIWGGSLCHYGFSNILSTWHQGSGLLYQPFKRVMWKLCL